MENNEQQFENQIENSIYKNNLFILGSFEKRITVYSQQVRSINLVYSLYKVYNFNLNTRIGIIGGGAAGITAAISAARLGATVHLYEKSSILNLWSQCKVRKIHPNIFDWPFGDWTSKSTNLPFLNWEYNVASDISQSLENEFRYYVEHLNNLNLHEEHNACLVEYKDKFTIKVNKEENTFDFIILTVGFGYDGSLLKNKIDVNRSYWANDNLDKIYYPKRKYIISGLGDGGIADALRIRIKKFSYLKYLELLRNKSLIEEILNIEKKVKNFLISRNRGKAATHIEEEYSKIECKEIDNFIDSELRTDTSLTLVTHSDYVYNPDSFPLNRFLLSRLIKVDNKNLSIVKNFNITEFNTYEFNKYWVRFNEEIIESDDLIFRRGTINPIIDGMCENINWDSNIIRDFKPRHELNISWRMRVFDRSKFTLSESKLISPDKEKSLKPIVKKSLSFAVWLFESKYNVAEGRAVNIENLGIGFAVCGKSIIISKPVSKNGFTRIKMLEENRQNNYIPYPVGSKGFEGYSKLKANVHKLVEEMTDSLEIILYYNKMEYKDLYPYNRALINDDNYFNNVLKETLSVDDLIYRTPKIMVTHNLLIFRNNITNSTQVIFVLRAKSPQVLHEAGRWSVSFEEQYDVISDNENIENTIIRGLEEEFGIKHNKQIQTQVNISTHGLFIEADSLNLAILGIVLMSTTKTEFINSIKMADDKAESAAIIGVDINDISTVLDKPNNFSFIEKGEYYKGSKAALGKFKNHEFHSSAKIRLAMAKWLLESSDILTKLDLNLDETSKGEN